VSLNDLHRVTDWVPCLYWQARVGPLLPQATSPSLELVGVRTKQKGYQRVRLSYLHHCKVDFN
jgi:hypothetical protein